MSDKFNEVLIVLVVCMVLFLILAAIIVLFLFLYQRRRFVQQQQMTELQLQFREQSLKAQLEIQEQTFLAISQEIHDNVGQLLSLAKVQINIINERARTETPEPAGNELLQSIKENIGQAMTDLRDLSKSLNSDRIRSASIHDTLLQEVERINKTGIIRITVSVEREVRSIEAQKKLILFRILQESIQNCMKHAEASTATISFIYGVAAIEVSVRDDGKGFDPGALPENGGGQGLENIRNRTRLTGGTCAINSSPGEGTHIILTIPYE